MSSSADTPGAHAARDMWEQRYGGDGYVYGTEPNGYLRECLPTLPLRPGSRVLCLAEGEGRNAVFLAQAGHEVHSVDLTETGVAKTLRLAADRGVPWLPGFTAGGFEHGDRQLPADRVDQAPLSAVDDASFQIPEHAVRLPTLSRIPSTPVRPGNGPPAPGDVADSAPRSRRCRG